MSSRDRARKREQARRRDIVTGKGGERVSLHLTRGIRHEQPSARVVVPGVQHLVIGQGRLLEDTASVAAYCTDMTLTGRSVPPRGPVRAVPSLPGSAHGPVKHGYKVPRLGKRAYKTSLRERLRRRELRSERYDSVRCNLPPEQLLFYERVKDSIRVGPSFVWAGIDAAERPRRSLTEAAQLYLAEHQDEQWSALQQHADRWLASEVAKRERQMRYRA